MISKGVATLKNFPVHIPYSVTDLCTVEARKTDCLPDIWIDKFSAR